MSVRLSVAVSGYLMVRFHVNLNTRLGIPINMKTPKGTSINRDPDFMTSFKFGVFALTGIVLVGVNFS